MNYNVQNTQNYFYQLVAVTLQLSSPQVKNLILQVSLRLHPLDFLGYEDHLIRRTAIIVLSLDDESSSFWCVADYSNFMFIFLFDSPNEEFRNLLRRGNVMVPYRYRQLFQLFMAKLQLPDEGKLLVGRKLRYDIALQSYEIGGIQLHNGSYITKPFSVTSCVNNYNVHRKKYAHQRSLLKYLA